MILEEYCVNAINDSYKVLQQSVNKIQIFFVLEIKRGSARMLSSNQLYFYLIIQYCIIK